MHLTIKYRPGLFIMLLLAITATAHAQITVQQLRCEMLNNPDGIDVVQPRLSWLVNGAVRGIQQTAYQVLVASSAQKLARNEGDIWNSGKVVSDQSVHIVYKGKPLTSRTTCYWKVKLFTNKGESRWSEAAHFSMGLLSPTNWQGQWIGLDKAMPWDSVTRFSRLSARYFRKSFNAPVAIKKATVYIAGLGLYELYVNGERIGDQVLAPAATDYTKSVLYNTYDVTAKLQKGDNVIATVLGNGRFFTMRQNYKPKKIKTFGFPKMLLQLEIEYTNGTKKTIVTDASWKMTPDGPIRTNNEYDGEEYDATKEMQGWNNNGFNDNNWQPSQPVEAPGGRLTTQMNEPVKIMQTVKPVTINQIKPGVFIMDMGQNMVGWLQMKLKANKGEQVKLRFAESMQAKGELYN